MLNNIRNFSKTIFAKILLVIIIIPFVFWGMGGVFSGGNTNNIARVNNERISTEDFIDYINSSQINSSIIKKNIEKNILEQILAELITKTILSLEVKKLNLTISDEVLNKKIKANKNFLDEKNSFSRVKYEKFLLSSNLSAPIFELRLKNRELQKNLFNYIGGGIKSPYFLTNNTFKRENKKIDIDYINLENIYKKKNSFSQNEIRLYVEKNKNELKQEYIDFSYVKITPETIIGTNEYNKLFFDNIDKIDNQISNGESFEKIIDELKIKPTNKKNYIAKDDDKEVEKLIYKNRNKNKIQLIEESDFYLFYKINKLEKILPDLNNKNFTNKISEILYFDSKYEYNKNLIINIENKKFNNENFIKLASDNSIKIKQLKLNSIKDNDKFDENSVKLLYELPKNTFALVTDKIGNIFLIKIKNLYEGSLSKESKDYTKFNNLTNLNISKEMYSSYDFFLNQKYEVKINQKTLERVKNYFR